jgi:WD40 repeat protein
MAVCPSGSCLVLGGGDGEIAIWDFVKNSAWLLEEGHTGWVSAVDVFPDNQRAISASGDKTIKIWNLHATRRDQRPAQESFVMNLIVKPDGKEAVSASPRDGLKVWDLSTLELIQSIPVPPPDRVARMEVHRGGPMSMQQGDFLAMAFFPDGRRCAWALQDKSVRVTDLDGPRELARLNQSGVVALAVTTDGRYVICASSAAISIWEWEANQVVSTIPTGRKPNVLVVSPDGKKLLVSSRYGNTVELMHLPSGDRLSSFNSDTDSVTAFAFSPDGARAWFASHDGTIRAWVLGTGEQLMTLSNNAAAVCSVAVFPDGRIISGTDDGTLKVWDTVTGRNIAIFSGDAPFRSCAVTSDGLLIAGDDLGRVHFLRLEG